MFKNKLNYNLIINSNNYYIHKINREDITICWNTCIFGCTPWEEFEDTGTKGKIIIRNSKTDRQASSCPVFSGVRVPWSLVFCVMFCRSSLVLLFFFSFGHSVSFRFTGSDYPLVSWIYGVWLPFGILDLRVLITLWYLRFTGSDYPLVS